jgi:thiamine transport system permease protein
VHKRRLGVLVALAVVPLAVLALFFVLPVTGMVGRGLRPAGHWDLPGVWHVFGRPQVHRVLWFTVWSSSVATAAAVVLGVPAAYALHRVRWPGRGLVRAVLLTPFVLPTVVVGVAFRELLGESGPLAGLGLDGTSWAIVLGLLFFNVSVVIRAVGAAWESLDPRPAEAAAALGAAPATVFRTVTLPALRPAIVSAASVVFLFCATSFGVVLTLGGYRHQSVETDIYLLTTELLDLRGAAALSLLQLVVVIALLVLAGRLRRSGVAVQRAVVRPRSASLRDVPQLLIVLALLALVCLPLGTLLVGSLRADGHWSLANYRALGHPNEVLPTTVTAALATSVEIACLAAAVALTLGVLVAVTVTRYAPSRWERRLRGLFDGLFMLPLGVSAVTLGFGLLITLDHPPIDFRNAWWLVPLAQALVALPLVARTLVPVLAGIDDRQRQAAASLGADPLRVFVTVDLAAMWRPLLAATGFAFAVSLGEFGATSFLVRSSAPTLPVVIYRLIGRPGDLNYGMALAGSCILAAACTALMLVVERLRVPSLGVL